MKTVHQSMSMKKFVNSSTSRVEALAVRRTPELLRVARRSAVRAPARAQAAAAVALVSGGGSGHEPLHTGYVGRGHARCRLPGPGVHLAHARPDGWPRRAQSRPGSGVLLHRQELRRRPAQLPDGQRHAGRPRSPMVLVNDDVAIEHSTHASGRRGVAGTVVVEKMVGAAAEARRRPVRLQGARRPGQRRHRVDGRGLQQLHRAGCGRADLRDRRARDGARRRHPRRARAAAACRSRRPARIVDLLLDPILKDLALARGPRGAAARQRPRRHAADGAATCCTTRRADRLRRRGPGAARARWSATTRPRSRWPARRSRSPRSTRRPSACGTRRCTRRRCAGSARALPAAGAGSETATSPSAAAHSPTGPA